MTTAKPGTRMTLSEYRGTEETDGGVCELINGEFCLMPPATSEHQFLIDYLVGMINHFTRSTQPIQGLAFTNIGLAIRCLP